LKEVIVIEKLLTFIRAVVFHKEMSVGFSGVLNAIIPQKVKNFQGGQLAIYVAVEALEGDMRLEVRNGS